MRKLLLILLLLFPTHIVNSISINKWVTQARGSHAIVYWNQDSSDKKNKYIYCAIFDDKGVKIGSQSYTMSKDHGSMHIIVPKVLRTKAMSKQCYSHNDPSK